MDNLNSPLTITPELLGLEDIEIIGTKLTSSGEIIIQVKSTRETINCHCCGKPTKAYGHGQPLRLRHLPILGHKTFIEITPRRGICEHCDKRTTTTQTLSWHNRNARHTKAYEQHILLLLVSSTISDVSIKENISDTAIQNILDRYISDKVDWQSIKKIGLLGIDEISLKKGYRDFVTVITAKLDGEIKILAVLKGREKATIQAFLESIPKKKQRTIVAVCCDMYEGYIQAAKETLGESIPIVIDRFHVAKLYRRCLVDIRQKELARLRKELSGEEYHALKDAIQILVREQEKLSNKDKQQLEKLFSYSPTLKAAYRFAQQLTAIFNANHRKSTAEKKLNAWIEKVETSQVRGFDSFIKTVQHHKNEILNYFTARYNSGFVEGLNNKIKVIKRRCYGIYNLKHLFQRLFLDLSGYHLFNCNQGVAMSC